MSKPLIGSYRLIRASVSEEDIRAYWRKRYGHEPECIKYTGGGILAGPVLVGEELRPGEEVMTGTVRHEEER